MEITRPQLPAEPETAADPIRMHLDEEIADAVMSAAFAAFDKLGALDADELTNLRYEKYRAIGQYRAM